MTDINHRRKNRKPVNQRQGKKGIEARGNPRKI